jgi:hypothetical protein
MASFTINAAPWPVGQPVNVYPAEAWPDPRATPYGAATTAAAVAAAGTVAFTGLDDNRLYVAYALGQGVRFGTATAGLQAPVATPDRERIKALEDALSGGGTGGSGGGSGGGTARVLTWDSEAANYVPVDWRSDTALPREFRGPSDPGTIPSITLAAYDTWTPSVQA